MDTGSDRRIKGVAIQGRGNSNAQGSQANHFVSYFNVSYKKVGWNSFSWVDGGATYTGNTGGGETVVRANFDAVVTARWIRIHPTEWHGYIVMRAGVYIETCACDTGYEYGTSCSPCSVGYYKDGTGTGHCIPCEAGTYSTSAGAGCWPPTPETASLNLQIDRQYLSPDTVGPFCDQVPIYVWEN